RPSDEARQSGKQDHGGKRIRTGDAEDQRDIGEQAVADAEDGGARRATLEIAVVGTFMRQTVLARPRGGNALGHRDSMPTSRYSASPAWRGSSRRCGAARSSGWRGSR